MDLKKDALKNFTIFTIVISLVALLTHSYFRFLTALWIIIGGIYIKKNGYKKTGFEKPIFIYILAISFSLVSAINWQYSLKEIYRHLFGFIAIFTVSQFSIDENQKRKYVDYCFKGVTVYYAIYSTLIVIGKIPSRFGDRVVPLDITPVEFSYIVGVIVIYNFSKSLLEKEVKIKMVDIVFFLLSIYIIILTKTRGAWIGIFISISAVYILSAKEMIKNFLKLMGIFTLGLYGLVSFRENGIVKKYYERIMSISNTTSDYSNIGRLDAWKIAWERFKEKPLTGFGYKAKLTYESKTPWATYSLEHPHNEIIALGVNTGAIGVLGYLYLMGVILYRGVKIRENLYWLMMAGVTIFSITYGFVELLLQVSNSLFLFLFILSLALTERKW